MHQQWRRRLNAKTDKKKNILFHIHGWNYFKNALINNEICNQYYIILNLYDTTNQISNKLIDETHDGVNTKLENWRMIVESKESFDRVYKKK